MPSTYTPIATTTLTTNTATVTFSSIPATYTDLVLVISAKGAADSGAWTGCKFNNDGGTNYSFNYILGNGTTGAGSGATGDTLARFGNLNTDTFTPIIVNIGNYASTSVFKTLISRFNDITNYVGSYTACWRSTTAINRIDIIFNGTTNMTSGSMFSLYGIKAA